MNFLILCRPVPRLGQDPNTEVELELEFNATSTVPVPKGSDIVDTLKEAVTNANSTFNFSVDLNSITVINAPATTTVPATIAITTAPPPVVELQVTLQQVFVPALTDPQSTEFKTLSYTITTICDTIFRQRYGLSYVHTTVTQFRPVPRLGQDPNTEVELELEFNATSTIPVPKGSDIVDTLKEAVTNPNSTFNFSVDLNSITVINAPATTTVPATIAITTAPPPVVELQVTLQQVFVPALTDPQSTEFKTLSYTITTICDTIFRQRYGLSYIQTTVTQFRPVPRLGQDPNTEVELELEFNATSTIPVPKGSDIVDTLKEAVTNPNSTFNFSVDLNSITVINAPATTTVPATIAITTAPPPVVELQVTLQQVFVPALTDPQSTEFKTLSYTITTICDTIFRQRYGLSYVQTTVTQFRPVPRLGQDPNTEVELELEFNATSTVPVPKGSDIVDTLKEAVTNANSTFNFSVDLNSITVINAPATTTVPATIAITTAPPPVVELQVTLQQVFVPALTDPQSTEFKTLSYTITTICDTIFRQRYGLSYVQTTVTQFRPVPRLGQDPNTEVELELEFNATSTIPVPKGSDIVDTLKEAVTNPNSTFNFSVDLNSITVINAPATTTVPATIAITTAPPPVVELQVTLQQVFVPALTDPQSTEFKTLSYTITTICDTIFRQRYGLSYVQTTVTQFRPVPRLGQDPNTEVELELEFNATSTVPVPKGSDIVDTLKEAVTNANSTFNFSVDLNSITVINAPATTTVPATIAITTAPPPVVELQVTLQQVFVPALTDPQSTEFKTLSYTITTICDTIFRQRYGLSYVQTTVTQFRPVPRLGQDPNTEVELELEFNATSTVPVPKGSDIVDTLKEAVTNANSTFNFSVDLNSITVINAPATTTVPATIAITTAPPPVVELQVTLQQVFVPALTDPQSTEFKTLSYTITTICDTIFRQRYGMSYVQTTVTQFRPVPRLGQDPNTEVELELEFNATSTVPVPKGSDIVDTLKEAVTNANSTFNFSVDLNSITVINAPATTTVPATIAITTAPPPVVELQVTLQQVFVPALTDPQSTEFKTLSDTITTICDTIFRQRYGMSYVQTTVTQFRPVPRLGQDPNTEVELELEFNATSTVPVPKGSDIVDTLKEAVTNANSTFNFSVDLNSITVINAPATTTVPATITITTAPPPVVELQVTLQQVFVPALTDPQSTEFKTLSYTITTICDTIFRQRYGMSYVQTTVTQFRPVPRLGQDPNTEVELELEFNATSTVPVPKGSDIVDTLKEAVTNANSTFNFSVDLNSITVINAPATTTVPSTIAITTAPPPVVELQVTLQQVFVPALTDPQSTEFKTLSDTITTICDTIFRQRYGMSYVQTTVTQFRPVPRLGQDPNTEVELELEFNATSTVPVPKGSDIVDTLKEAVTNANSTFNFSVDLNSITVINAPATTTVPATIAITTAPPPVVELQVTLQQVFVPALTDPQSTEFKTLSYTITTICDTIFRQRYGLSYVQTTVTQFRPVPRLGQDPNTEVELELEFNATSTIPVPKGSDIVDTLKEAVTNPNSTFNFSVDLNSITVINAPATTTVPATIAITTAPPPVVELQVTLQQVFVPALTDPQSTEFKTLSYTITTICDTIFRQRYGLSYVQTTVTQFRPVPRLGQDPNTEVELELEFNATSTIPVPKGSDIVDTLKEAVTNPNSTFNFSVDLNSITVINAPATTTVPATIAITTAPPPVVELQVTLQQVFVPALTDPQSTEFKTLSYTITTICDTIFRQRYGLSYVQTTVTQFRPVPRLGQDPNTEVELELEFNATSTIPVPKGSDIVDTLKEAVTNPNSTFNFSVDLNSITVINAPATTTVPATIAITTAPPPVVELQVTLQQVFVPALTDPQSTEFKTLSYTITTICDTIFRQRYGLSYVQTTVTQFRPVPRLGQDPNTEVELELEFNATSTIPVPKGSDIVDILKEAVTNPNSTFNFSVDLNSITVINAPATTTVPATIAITTAPPPVVELQVTLQQVFVPALTDPQSTEFKTLSYTITTICDTIFRQRYGLSYVQTTVTQFRPVPRLGQDPNTEVELELEFNATSTIPVPKGSDIVDTLKEAVTNPNSTFNFSVDLNSITVINAPATTTVPATIAITTAPPPVVELQVTLQQVFVPALTDPQSTEFKTLSYTITTICDTIFRQRYGLSYVQTTVTQFRPVPRLGQDPNTEVELELEFNATSTIPVPKGSDIVDTLKEAVTNPNSTFNFSVDLNSITVINAPATTTVPATIAITTAPPPVVELQVTLQQVFVPALTDPQSTEFKTLSYTITTICDTIFRQRYGLSYVQTTVTQFRPVPRLGQDPNTEVELELEFNATSTVPVPKGSDIVDTLKEAVTNPNSTFNFSVDLNSITVINAPATTTVPATIAITTAPPPVVELQVTLQQVFVPALTDPQSTEFKTLSYTITTICDTIFRQRYGLSYVQTTVTQFRPVPRLGQDPNTEVELELEFNATSTVPVPKGSDIVDTLKEAVTNPNSTFNFSVDLNSITVIRTPSTATDVSTNTTAPPVAKSTARGITTTTSISVGAPVTSTVPVTTVPGSAITIPTGEPATVPVTGTPIITTNVTTNTMATPIIIITDKNTMTAPTTTTAVTATTTPFTTSAPTTTSAPITTTVAATITLTTMTVEFTSRETFTSDLSNSSSQLFQTRASLIKTQLEPFYQSAFTSFNSLTVTKFRNGSIINTMNLAFRSSVLNSTKIGTILINSAQKITAFNIDTTTIKFNGTGGPTSAVLTITAVAGTTITQPTGEPATVPVTGPATTTTYVALTGVPDTSTGATTITTATPVIATVVTAAPTTTTAAATTTSVATITLTTVSVEFTSKGETFISDLSTSSSQAFQTRASLIKTQLEPFYQSAFTSFNSLTVIQFRNGSIINTMNLAFSSSAVPNSKEIDTVLIKAAHYITAFNINPTSVTVNGEVVTSSGISSKTSLFTASCLVVLSLLLSS
ncbi:mucin-17 isoform X1 [Salmo trutta]|uniref:mucin-17 isoform X1 n=1 Tax=Salmo trutta TaxID=8032 RepID=UPI001132948A|nr:mucin-17-like isoform X1 [Salmo trutta]